METKDREANARLIAAAPELLAALRDCRAAIHHFLQEADDEAPPPSHAVDLIMDLAIACATATAALAKVEGV